MLFNRQQSVIDKIEKTIMFEGKKNLSEKLFFKNIKQLQKTEIINHKQLIKQSVFCSSLVVKTKTIKKKKKIIKEFPFLIKKFQRLAIGVKLLLNTVKLQEKNYSNFIDGLLTTSKNTGFMNKKINEIHKNAFEKKKYARFRWF